MSRRLVPHKRDASEANWFSNLAQQLTTVPDQGHVLFLSAIGRRRVPAVFRYGLPDVTLYSCSVFGPVRSPP